MASGFCGLLYQVVWVRLAFAAFGVITPVLSVVLSVFMLGLALGSWAAGRWIGPLTSMTGKSAIWFYAGAELLIGASAFIVPRAFAGGEAWLLSAGGMDSARYLILSASILAVSLLPWCFLMGTTFPLVMAYIKEDNQAQQKSFSYLYLANVIGAMCGTLVTACVLIELMGFRRCLIVAGVTNFLIAAVAASLGRRAGQRVTSSLEAPQEPPPARQDAVPVQVVPWLLAAILFTTGFASMAMEVVWTRAFTPILRTTIYSFASLLAVYLLATWIGSLVYRRHMARGRVWRIVDLLAILAMSSFLPILAMDPRWDLPYNAMVVVTLASLFPFCATLGYLTPRLIDDYSAGAPRPAGKAYAVNIAGCILGPLFAGYVLLPLASHTRSLVLLSVPFIVFYLLQVRSTRVGRARFVATIATTVVLLATSLFEVISYEDGYDCETRRYYKAAVVRRDHVATIVSCGEGMGKRLMCNGIALTHLTPITKMMAHVPLAMLKEKPASALVVCLGMGTTFRSLASWDVDTTAVELVPGVRDAFGYYHRDADAILRKPNARIVVDDGRRFLNRTTSTFDVITIDPPPPMEAAGSSLLYSEEFCSVVKSRLTDRGIFLQWCPGGERQTMVAMIRAVCSVFPHVRIFSSIEGWGIHVFASMRSLDMPTVPEFVNRLPRSAAADLVEWSHGQPPASLYVELMRREISLPDFLAQNPDRTVTDDRPYNEYFLLRRLGN